MVLISFHLYFFYVAIFLLAFLYFLEHETWDIIVNLLHQFLSYHVSFFVLEQYTLAFHNFFIFWHSNINTNFVFGVHLALC